MTDIRTCTARDPRPTARRSCAFTARIHEAVLVPVFHRRAGYLRWADPVLTDEIDAELGPHLAGVAS
jgi:hypothetical protein